MLESVCGWWWIAAAVITAVSVAIDGRSLIALRSEVHLALSVGPLWWGSCRQCLLAVAMCRVPPNVSLKASMLRSITSAGAAP